jgi:hypothetical protein
MPTYYAILAELPWRNASSEDRIDREWAGASFKDHRNTMKQPIALCDLPGCGCSNPQLVSLRP